METPPYEGYVDMIRSSPDGVLYYCSIGGRESGQFSWEGPLRITHVHGNIAQRLSELSNDDQIPFGIVFPHLTRFLAWQSPRLGKRETNLYDLGLYRTIDLESVEPEGLRAGETFVGCGLEIVLLAHETRLWYDAPSVEAYLKAPRGKDDITCASPNKLRDDTSP